MSEDDKELQKRFVKRLENNVKHLEETQKDWIKSAEEYRRRVDFTKGVVLGLVLGIVGNLLVQFFYPVVESLVLGEYTNVFWANMTISAVALVIIVYITVKYRSQLSQEKSLMKVSIENQENMKEAIETYRQVLERELRKLEEM